MEFVSRAIDERLSQFPQLVGISSLAAGSDQMFARIVLSRGGQLEVVVPSSSYEYSFEDREARRSYESLLALAIRVEILSFSEPSEEAYLSAGHRVVDLSDRLMAIWDGQPSRGKGGTADVVQFARTLGKPVDVIWPDGIWRERYES
jgi:hypothetical protein